MRLATEIWPTPNRHLTAERPDHPVLYFSPEALRATAQRFFQGFPGLVTYAVKANDAPEVIENLAASGMTAFDVASPEEMRVVRAAAPNAAMHYNNPVRSAAEIAFALEMGVSSYAIDAQSELDKLRAAGVPTTAEIAVRLRLPVTGAAYDFGAKFGADPAEAARLLRQVAEAGYRAAMTFHPGTQCTCPKAWAAYIDACAAISREAGVRLVRLNVGGGFPAWRSGRAPELEAIFDGIADSVARAFGADAPALVCEPGRAMVAEAFSLAARVKAVRSDGAIFLNDGIYGGLQEASILGAVDRVDAIAPGGRPRTGAPLGRVVFGPTCDSLDRVPGEMLLPGDIAEGDWLLFRGMGAYSRATVTRFNGYGALEIVTVGALF